MHSSGPLKKKKTEKMVLTEEGFQAFVEKLSECGGLKCKFCGQIFAVTTSISRFKWHWSGVEGRGVKVCAQVPSDIQEAAFLAMLQPPNKKHKTIEPSTSNAIGAISTSTQGQVNQVSNLVGGLERMELEQEVAGEERASPHAHDHMGSVTEGMTQEIRRDTLQAPDQVGQVDIENTDWGAIASIAQFMEVDVQNGTGGCAQPVAGASSSASLPCNISHQTRGDPLPTGSTKLVGEAFGENKNAIWSWLMNDEVSFIGIYGMGGVGKTELMRHIYYQLPSTFCHSYWITVSQDFRISRLQNLVARRIGLDLSNEDEELYRAAKLSKELVKKQNWVLILDDLWDHFELHKVGIPILQKKGCKLILTTRSQRVCRRMICQKMIKVEPLTNAEAWTLFTEKLGHDGVLSPKVEEIAKSITRECDGLPLGIMTMAGIMRGVVDIREWRNALKALKESKVRKDDMEPEVFKILKFSYNHLNDSALQQCFLYCALFPEDYRIGREMLIYFLISEGIIEEMPSLLAQFDKGHAILNKLEDICLLESCEMSFDDRVSFEHGAVRMHDLIRDMALQILQENSHVMVKAGKRLEELPSVEKWNVNLVRVSLMENDISTIPQSHVLRCPYLSTLLLCRNYRLQSIAEAFFKQFHDLKVLDLSDTSIKILPESVSDLVTLDALLLRNCRNLMHTPSLKKLRALRRLDLGGTKLENLPNGMEWLSNLRYLRLSGFGVKKFPIGILPKLSHLQVFIQDAPFGWVKGKDVACLRKLEILQCYFEHLSDLGEYVKSRDQTQSLSSYALNVGGGYGCMNKSVGLCCLSINREIDFHTMFPNDMKELHIYKCDGATSLCDVSSSVNNATELEVINIRFCEGMKSLLSSSWFSFAPLEPLSSHGPFLHLKKLICYECWNMKKLFPLVLLPSLVNLEVIFVEGCDRLEEIIATTDEGEVADTGEECCCSSSYSITEFSLPNLTDLQLLNLPELKSICTAKLRCNSLEEICVSACRKLKRMPFSLSLLDNGQPTPPPSLRNIYIPGETWESVGWDHPNAKDVLQPFVTFLY